MFGCVMGSSCRLKVLSLNVCVYRFSVLIGPVNHFKHLISKERLPFSAVYFSSLGLTLYFALAVQSYLGSLVAGSIQVRHPSLLN